MEKNYFSKYFLLKPALEFEDVVLDIIDVNRTATPIG
jgi:hypothetical protein